MKREWQRLGNTLLDLSQIVKIEFERPDARLFTVAGEALLMSAWTEQRGEVLNLKQLASEANGWVMVAGEAREAGDEDGGSEPESGSTPYPVEPHPDDVVAPQVRSVDHRVRLDLVDKVVYLGAAGTTRLELFSGGVFLGQVLEPESIEAAEQYLRL